MGWRRGTSPVCLLAGWTGWSKKAMQRRMESEQ